MPQLLAQNKVQSVAFAIDDDLAVQGGFQVQAHDSAALTTTMPPRDSPQNKNNAEAANKPCIV